MNKNERFILVRVYADYSVSTIIDNFNRICKEIEYELNKIETREDDTFNVKKMIVYDRQESDSDTLLNCQYTIYDGVVYYGNVLLLYTQFIDSYYGDENL